MWQGRQFMRQSAIPIAESNTDSGPVKSQTQSQDRAVGFGPTPLPINPDLVWDYDLPGEQQSEAFRRWYIARVLTRGRAADIRTIGPRTIHAYLPQLTLPARIRRFWEWYFSLPDVRRRYGSLVPPAT
jgi:hypothetical protein